MRWRRATRVRPSGEIFGGAEGGDDEAVAGLEVRRDRRRGRRGGNRGGVAAFEDLDDGGVVGTQVISNW